MSRRPLTTNEKRIFALEKLVESQYPNAALGVVAGLLEVNMSDLKELLEGTGWPRVGAMRTALERLKRGEPVGGVWAPAPAAGGIDALLREAEKHGSAETRRRAGRIRASVELLRGQVMTDRVDREQEAERRAAGAKLTREITELEEQLRAKREALRGRGMKVPARGVRRGETGADRMKSRAIREWARENGIACGSAGRVPQVVRTAYEEAMERVRRGDDPGAGVLGENGDPVGGATAGEGDLVPPGVVRGDGDLRDEVRGGGDRP